MEKLWNTLLGILWFQILVIPNCLLCLAFSPTGFKRPPAKALEIIPWWGKQAEIQCTQYLRIWSLNSAESTLVGIKKLGIENWHMGQKGMNYVSMVSSMVELNHGKTLWWLRWLCRRGRTEKGTWGNGSLLESLLWNKSKFLLLPGLATSQPSLQLLPSPLPTRWPSGAGPPSTS